VGLNFILHVMSDKVYYSYIVQYDISLDYLRFETCIQPSNFFLTAFVCLLNGLMSFPFENDELYVDECLKILSSCVGG